MGRYVTGVLKSEIHFCDVYVEDGQDIVDAVIPDGWEGEMLSHSEEIEREVEEDEE